MNIEACSVDWALTFPAQNDLLYPQDIHVHCKFWQMLISEPSVLCWQDILT